MKRSLTLLPLFALASTAASASPFYIDAGMDYGGSPPEACAACTGLKDEFLYKYQSYSKTISDVTPGGLQVGDTITTMGGLDIPPPDWGLNFISGFDPSDLGLSGTSNNGYGSTNWAISFGFSNLVGQITAIDPSGAVQVLWGSGNIDFYVSFDGGISGYNFMDVAVNFATDDGHGIYVDGYADFTNVGTTVGAGYTPDNAGFDYRTMFHDATGSICDGTHYTSYFDIWTNCGDNPGDHGLVHFMMHNDTNVVYDTDFDYVDPDGIADNGDEYYEISSDHDGSGTGTPMPEPATIALFGTSILLLGGMARRRRRG